jgi:hypothetical protein
VNILRLAVHPAGPPRISSVTPACSIPLIHKLRHKSRDDAGEALGERIGEIESYLPREPPVGTAANQPMASDSTNAALLQGLAEIPDNAAVPA